MKYKDSMGRRWEEVQTRGKENLVRFEGRRGGEGGRTDNVERPGVLESGGLRNGDRQDLASQRVNKKGKGDERPRPW